MELQEDMSVEELALELPRREKLKLMETLWADLSGSKEGFESPEWHKAALGETEARLAAGTEEAVDWAEAKRRLATGR